MGADRSVQGIQGMLRTRAMGLALPVLAVALLLCLGSAASAGAAVPSHPRTPSLDVVGLNHACGVAVDTKGDLYAASAAAGKVLIYSPADHETPIGEIANANEPCALALTSAGVLYVSEAKTGEVVRYVPTAYPFVGAPSYGPREVIDSSKKAKGIAVDPFDDRLYVADGSHVSVYDAKGNLGVNEVQEVRCFQCTGGKYKLEFEGETTPKSIPFEGSAKEFEEALLELGALEPGDVSVENGANNKIHLVTFKGKYAHTDVPPFKCIPEGIEGPGTQECKVTETAKGFGGHIGEGQLSEATGVAPFTYKSNESQITYSLAVADAAGDQVKLFSASGKEAFKEEQLRQPPLTGPAAGEKFGFGAAGAYLGTDRGTCPPATKACTAGHFFLYDDAHEALDEFEASGALVSQTSFPFGDGAPTAIAVDRSGGEGNGTLYATSGAGTGARVLAFGALSAPTRPGPLAERSLALATSCSVAIDDYGNRYVAVGTEVFVYPPSGGTGTKPLVKISLGEKTCRIAVDGEGNLYALLKEKVAYFKPSSFPPKEATTYEAPVTVAKKSEFSGSELSALTVNPANGHLFVTDGKQVIEYKAAKEGSEVVNKEIGAGLPISNIFSLAVYGANGDVYLATSGGGGSVFVLDPSGKEILVQITGQGSPAGSFGASAGAIAVDQSNGHVIAFEPGRKDLEEYEASGTYVAAFGSFESLVTTNYGVAVDNGEHSPNKGGVYLAYDDTKGAYDLWAFGGLGYSAPSPLPKFTLTVKKTGTGSGTVTSDLAGISCGKACSAEFEEGTKVVLQATAESGSTFNGWTGCKSELKEPKGACLVTMSAAKEVTAKFEKGKPSFVLKVKLAGTGTGLVTSSPAGINCGIDCEEPYEEGTVVTLTGASGANTKPVQWTGCDSVDGENKCLVTMSAAKEVTATFDLEQHLLSVSKEGSGSGTVTSSPSGINCGETCSANFDHGTVVTLLPKPDPGSELTAWSGACAGSGACEVTMSEARSVTATFEKVEKPGIALTVSLEGTGSGTVTSNVGLISCEPFCSDKYAEGTKVTLTASPSSGSLFMAWKHCDSGGVNGRQCTVTMDKAKEVSAVFVTAHLLTVAKAPGSGPGKVQSYGGITCLYGCTEVSALIKEGTAVIVKQTPARHFHFAGWGGDCSGTGACELTMGEDHEVTADFEEDAKFSLSLSKAGGGQALIKTKPAGVLCGFTCIASSASFYEGEAIAVSWKLNKGTTKLTWSKTAGTCTGTFETLEGTCTVTMSAAKELTATLE